MFLGIGNLTEYGHLDLSDVRHIREEDFPKWTRRVEPRPGDIVFTYEATLNRYAVIPPEFRGCLGRRLALIRPNNKIVNTRFLFYSFFGADWRATIEANRLAGATVDRIPIAKFPDFPIELPPLEIQNRIAGILSAYDDLIEVNTRRIAILEEMARRLFDEWFVLFRFPSAAPSHPQQEAVVPGLGRPGPGIHEHRHAPNDFPRGWRRIALSEVAAVNNDTLSPRAAPSVINYIDISSVSPGSVNEIRALSFEDAPGRARRRVKDGDVIWSTVRPNRRSYALLLRVDPNTIASTGFAVLSAQKVPWSYLYLAVTTDQFVAHLEGRTRGAAYPAVTPPDFQNALILAPPEATLDEFHRRTGPLLELMAVLREQNARLSAARDLLLPKLISGEIDLSGAERQVERAPDKAAAE